MRSVAKVRIAQHSARIDPCDGGLLEMVDACYPRRHTQPFFQTSMTAQDQRFQNSRRSSRSRNVPANGANYTRVSLNTGIRFRSVDPDDLNRPQGRPDDEWEDVQTHRSVSPAMSNASRLRARRPRAEFIASQPSTPRKRRRQPPPQPARRKYHVEYSESCSDVEETHPLRPPPPHLPPVEPIVQMSTPQGLFQIEPPPVAEPVFQQQLAEFSREYGVPILGYTVRVVADAFRFCRRFFSYALGIFILWFLVSMMTSQLVFFTRPVCSIPIVSPMIPFCHWDIFKQPSPDTGRPVQWANYTNLVDIQTKTFDQLLDENVGSRGLTTEVKKAEMAGNDLITLVRVSDLKSRDQVAERLAKFVEDARGTGRSLHALGAKIHGAIDS